VEGVEGPRVRDKKKNVEELKRKAREAPRSDSRTGVIRDDEDGRDVAIISFDELGPIEVRPERGSNWAREEHRDRVPATYNRRNGVRHLLAAYDLVRDRMYAHVKMHKTNVEFLAFLKYVRSLYPLDVLLYVILDNFSPHTVPRVLEYAAAHKIEFALTPTNASWLNPIESHVGPLIKFALSNFDPKDHAEIARNVRRYIAWRNRHPPSPTGHRPKRIRAEGPKLCGRCGMEILERH